MWIQLTESNGQPIAINTDHIVTVQAYGDRTKVIHVSGQAIVAESMALVLSALGLRSVDDRNGRDADQPLHS